MKTVITSEYEALFRQHFRLATLYAERIVGSAHEAEDIVQEVFIALLDVDFSQIRQKESYLYRCVRNAALDHLHARMKNRFYDINSKETVRLAAEENAPGNAPRGNRRRKHRTAGNDSARKCRARKPTGDAALRHPPFCVPETADQSVTGISLFTFFEPTRA